MQVRKFNSSSVAAPIGGYCQVCEVSSAQRTVFVSGQIPQPLTGEVPQGFDDQCRLAWRNVEAQLATVDMTLANLVKVTTYLSDRKYRVANRAIRAEVLGDNEPALTVIVAGIMDEKWLLEIEAVAMA